MWRLNSIYKTIRSKCSLHSDATTPPRMRTRGQRYKIHVYLTADALSPSQYGRKAGTCSILWSASILPPRTACKIPETRGRRWGWSCPFPQVHSRILAIGLKTRAGPVGGKLHSLGESCSISQLTPNGFFWLGTLTQNRALHSFLGFHRFGFSAELSPPTVRGSGQNSQAWAGEGIVLDSLPLHFYESEMGGGMNVTTLGTCARRWQRCFSCSDKKSYIRLSPEAAQMAVQARWGGCAALGLWVSHSSALLPSHMSWVSLGMQRRWFLF